jgi:3D-(3,5/4)-trihydroxycyclohexane-1,2-dione acylhydrolase (decyclizing)
MSTIRLTMAQALVRFLTAQTSEIEDNEMPLVAGIFAIFGHGNVAGLGEALYEARDRLPTLRAHNEQAMALAATAFAKASRRRRMMACTTSIGPGATNMVTAAAVAYANRLPVLLLPGDVFASRRPDPVLQQIEGFGDPTISVNDCFRPVSRWWDRITRPEQLIESLPQAMRVLTDPADCGPVTLALPQDVQTEAYDYPEDFFRPRFWRVRRPPPDPAQLADAVAAVSHARAPLIIAGGGVHYAFACDALADFAQRHGIPVVETQAGKGALAWDHPCNAGGLGVKLALPEREIWVLVGDGSYLMMNSEIASSVQMGQKLNIVVLDNGGFGCISRLQQGCGGSAFNNLFAEGSGVDFAAHAASLGARSRKVASLTELDAALREARAATRTSVVVIATDPTVATASGGAWWDVAVPEASSRREVAAARAAYDIAKARQRIIS